MDWKLIFSPLTYVRRSRRPAVGSGDDAPQPLSSETSAGARRGDRPNPHGLPGRGERADWQATPDRHLGEIAEPAAALPDPVRAAGARLANRDALPMAEFNRLWADALGTIGADDLVIGQDDYLRTHRRRFHELFNAVSTLTDERPRVLEFGTSEASRLYRHVKPRGTLVTADRPVADDYVGFTATKSQRLAGSRDHVAIDLEVDAPGDHRGLKAAGPYDLIVFTEVLEHLVADPKQLIAGLLSQLRRDGYLYITTPNFLARANRRAIAQGHNPQPFYPGAAADWDRHHHFREYSMKELLEIAETCGACIHAAYYSDCWDHPGDPELVSQPDLRGNLVLVLRPGNQAAQEAETR